GVAGPGYAAKGLAGLEPRRAQCPAIAAPAFQELGIARLRCAYECDCAPPLLKQMIGGVETALLVVRRHGRSELPFGRRAPPHEMRAALDQLLELGPVLEIVAIAEEDDPVGLVAVFVIEVPVGRQLLE